jgi:sterol 3beta-glucosyltransferase
VYGFWVQDTGTTREYGAAMIRVGIQTWGSEGDVRPFVSLARGLAAAGHQVTLMLTDVTGRRYGECSGVCIHHVAMRAPLTDAQFDAHGRAIVARRTPAGQAARIIGGLFSPLVDELFDASRRLAHGSDVVVRHHVVHPAQTAAELAGVPDVSVVLSPDMLETDSRAPTGVPPLGRLLNPMAWSAARLAVDAMLKRDLNRQRRRHGLAPLRDVMRESWISPHATLVATSPHLFARPTDWGDSVELTGFLNRPYAGEERIAAPVERFLSDGPPPVYGTFGSLMPRCDGERQAMLRLLVSAIRLAGMRALVQGAPDVVRPSDDVLLVPRSPHRAVLPSCAAVVHHGGAGTSQAVVEAGVPSVVVPHLADQFFWATHLRALGLAPKPVWRSRVTPERLARRLGEVVHDRRYLERARRAGEHEAMTDGIARAVSVIEHVGSSRGDALPRVQRHR